MNRQEIMEILAEYSVIRDGHFVLTSGRHTDRFLLCNQLTMYPDITKKLVSQLAQKVKPFQPNVIVGPAMGGVILAYELASILGSRAMFAEKQSDETMALKRGFVLDEDDRVFIIEDAVSTGGSVRKVIDAVKSTQAQLLGVAALFDRTSGQVDFDGVPFLSLMEINITSYDQDDCPLCRAGLPLIKPKS